MLTLSSLNQQPANAVPSVKNPASMSTSVPAGNSNASSSHPSTHKNPKRKLFLFGGLFLAVLVVGLASAYFLLQNSQDIRQQAAGDAYGGNAACSFTGQCVNGYRCAAPGLLSSESCGTNPSTPPNPGAGCTSNAQCASGYICFNGACKGNQAGSSCFSQSDCAPGYNCTSGKCQAATPIPTSVPGGSCTSDAQCGPGYSCRLSSGVGGDTALKTCQSNATPTLVPSGKKGFYVIR